MEVTGLDRLLIGGARCLRLIPVQEVAQFYQRLDVARIGSLPVERRDDRGCLRCPRWICLESLEHLVFQFVQCGPAIGAARRAGQHVRDALAATKPEDHAQELQADRIPARHGTVTLSIAESVGPQQSDRCHHEPRGLLRQKTPHSARPHLTALAPARSPAARSRRYQILPGRRRPQARRSRPHAPKAVLTRQTRPGPGERDRQPLLGKLAGPVRTVQVHTPHAREGPPSGSSQAQQSSEARRVGKSQRNLP